MRLRWEHLTWTDAGGRTYLAELGDTHKYQLDHDTKVWRLRAWKYGQLALVDHDTDPTPLLRIANGHAKQHAAGGAS